MDPLLRILQGGNNEASVFYVGKCVFPPLHSDITHFISSSLHLSIHFLDKQVCSMFGSRHVGPERLPDVLQPLQQVCYIYPIYPLLVS